MIVVDSSALIAIVKSESEASTFSDIITNTSRVIIGAPTKLEMLMVAYGHKQEAGMNTARLLLDEFGIETHVWTDAFADIATDAFLTYGKGHHRAALNYGDCMTYALAKSLDAPLLFKGDDFRYTDLKFAI